MIRPVRYEKGARPVIGRAPFFLSFRVAFDFAQPERVSWNMSESQPPFSLSEVEGQGHPAAHDERRDGRDYATPFAAMSRSASWKRPTAATLNPAILIRPEPAM